MKGTSVSFGRGHKRKMQTYCIWIWFKKITELFLEWKGLFYFFSVFLCSSDTESCFRSSCLHTALPITSGVIFDIRKGSNNFKDLGDCASVHSQCLLGSLKHDEFEILVNTEKVQSSWDKDTNGTRWIYFFKIYFLIFFKL